MDIVKDRAKELMKFSIYELQRRAKELRIKDNKNVGKVKLAVLIAVKEYIGDEIQKV